MTRVAAVHLDFVHVGPVSRAAILLLAVGAVAALAVVHQHKQVTTQLNARQDRLAQMRSMSQRARPAIEPAASDTPEVRAQIKQANAVLAQLNVPWSELFGAIESAQDGSVALLQVQPDARSRTVLIGGAARSLPALLRYMTRLERTEDLKDVLLVSHEVKTKEAGQPVQFVLSAGWVEP